MSSSTNDGEFGLQIAPMLDVLFVLLLFFMVSAGIQKHEASLTTPLPGHGQGPANDVRVTVEIDADGQVTLNGAPMDSPTDHQLPQMLSRLKAIVANSPDRAVIISPAASARHQRVVDVLNACKACHVQNLAFNTAG